MAFFIFSYLLFQVLNKRFIPNHYQQSCSFNYLFEFQANVFQESRTSGLVTFSSYLFFHLQQSLTNEVIYDGKHIICTSVTFPSFSVQFSVCSSHHIINERKCVMFSFVQVHSPHSHCYIISITFTLSFTLNILDYKYFTTHLFHSFCKTS